MATKKTTAKTTAKTSASTTPKTTTSSSTQGAVRADADHDRVVMASRAPDGTPAQFDPEYIGPKDVVEEAAAEQLTQQKVSAVDQAERGVVDTGGVLASDQTSEGSSEPDPVVGKLVKAHESAEKAAKRQAKSEVDSLHKGLGE
jgi:hypothetical protein